MTVSLGSVEWRWNLDLNCSFVILITQKKSNVFVMSKIQRKPQSLIANLRRVHEIWQQKLFSYGHVEALSMRSSSRAECQTPSLASITFSLPLTSHNPYSHRAHIFILQPCHFCTFLEIFSDSQMQALDGNQHHHGLIFRFLSQQERRVYIRRITTEYDTLGARDFNHYSCYMLYFNK